MKARREREKKKMRIDETRDCNRGAICGQRDVQSHSEHLHRRYETEERASQPLEMNLYGARGSRSIVRFIPVTSIDLATTRRTSRIIIQYPLCFTRPILVWNRTSPGTFLQIRGSCSLSLNSRLLHRKNSFPLCPTERTSLFLANNLYINK